MERSRCWSKFSGRMCGPAGDLHWNNLFLKNCTPWKGHMLEQFVKNCSPWEGPKLEKFLKDCLPWVGPHAGEGIEREEEGVAEVMPNELTPTPIPHPLHCSRKEAEKLGVKLQLGRREG